MRYNRNEVAYDNRFGFAKCCKAYWFFDPNRVGEQFLFTFPNGMKVSVIRHTSWSYHYAEEGNSFACSYGFACGTYEALVWNPAGEEVEQHGYMDHKRVHQLLSKYRNYRER